MFSRGTKRRNFISVYLKSSKPKKRQTLVSTQMSVSDDEGIRNPYGGHVSPPSPSKSFCAAHEKVEAALDDSTPSIQPYLQPSTSGPAIPHSHPGPPRLTNRRWPDFDPVSFVLGRCRADPVLAKRFKLTDRKRFLIVLHRGFFCEVSGSLQSLGTRWANFQQYPGFGCWSRVERVALAGHLLLLGAIARCEVDAVACRRHLQSERFDLDVVVTVALAWGAASEDLLPRQDLRLTGVTPARPSQWCLTNTLCALTSLLRATTQPKFKGTESSSALCAESFFERPALPEVAMTARALALCALDAAPGQTAEYIPVFAAVLAAAKPWTEEAVASMANALHFPGAHPHLQVWLLEHVVVNEEPLRKRMAHRQLLALLASAPEPISGSTDKDNLHKPEEPEAMAVQESPASRASNTNPTAHPSEGFALLAGLVQLLSRQRGVVNAMDFYRKFLFLLILQITVGDNPVASTEEVTELQNLIAWLPALKVKQPAGTCQVTAVIVETLVAALRLLWQRAVDRFNANVVIS